MQSTGLRTREKAMYVEAVILVVDSTNSYLKFGPIFLNGNYYLYLHIRHSYILLCKVLGLNY